MHAFSCCCRLNTFNMRVEEFLVYVGRAKVQSSTTDCEVCIDYRGKQMLRASGAGATSLIGEAHAKALLMIFS